MSSIREQAQAARAVALKRSQSTAGGGNTVTTQAEPGYEVGLDNLEKVAAQYPDLVWAPKAAQKAQILAGTDDPTVVGQLASPKVRGKARQVVTVHTSGSIVWLNVEPIELM